jgi:anti-sigma regulatory factor (Ser/Thr protein kinase)
MKYAIRAGDIDHGGSASARIKSELTKAGVDAMTARRAGIVSFEGEMNLIVYSDDGGTLSVSVEPDAVIIELEDTGPGIEDIDLAMTPGYSTAPVWATDLGFGAGMGLINMQKHSDQFEIHSKLGVGTTIRCQIERKGDWAMKRREGI